MTFVICNICGAECDDPNELLQHKASKHSKTENIIGLPVTVPGKETVTNIQRVPSYDCSVCGKKFTAPEKLGRHKTSHRNWTCPSCNTTIGLNGKGRHILYCKGAKPDLLPLCSYDCKICGEKFPSYHSLNAHMGKHREKPAPKPVPNTKDVPAHEAGKYKPGLCQVCLDVWACDYDKPLVKCPTCGNALIPVSIKKLVVQEVKL